MRFTIVNRCDRCQDEAAYLWLLLRHVAVLVPKIDIPENRPESLSRVHMLKRHEWRCVHCGVMFKTWMGVRSGRMQCIERYGGWQQTS